MSGVDFDGREVRKGAADAIRNMSSRLARSPPELTTIVESISKAGTPWWLLKTGWRWVFH
jgi:high-affinity K+ transport system ATPase subunit B